MSGPAELIRPTAISGSETIIPISVHHEPPTLKIEKDLETVSIPQTKASQAQKSASATKPSPSPRPASTPVTPSPPKAATSKTYQPVIRRNVQPPKANVNRPPASAAVFYVRDPPKLSCAPFPFLPQGPMVKQLLNEIEAQIIQKRNELILLNRAKNSVFAQLTKVEEANPSIEIQDHFGMLIPHRLVNSILNDNQKKASTTHKKYRVHRTRMQYRYTHISHYHFFQSNIEIFGEFLDYIFRTVLSIRSFADEKAQLFAREYANRRRRWEEYLVSLNRLIHEQRILKDYWPPEFRKALPKDKVADQATLLKFTAPDQPMYLEDLEFYSYELYTMNGLVEDPVKAHREFKERHCWTEFEKNTFLDKYALHPREFKKIAQALPQKSVKDVIEYYYIHRIDLNLHDIELNSKSRRRKKVIAEGSVRK